MTLCDNKEESTIKLKTVLYLIIVLLTGCETSDNSTPIQNEFSYQFSSDAEGWAGDFADYPQGAESFYELLFEYSILPYPLDETNGSLKISGNNHSDDLFMFIKKKISGLMPNASYQLIFTVEFASNVADGMVGIGGSPGEGVTIKAGATQVEPVKELDAYDNYYRMNIDKSNQSQGGEDMMVIGDFSNDTDQNVYTLKSVTSQTPFQVQANSDGELWLVVGSDSGFEGTTSIYYSKIEVLLN